MLKYFIIIFLCCMCYASSQDDKLYLLRIYPVNDAYRLFLEQLKHKYDIWYASDARYDIAVRSSNLPLFMDSLGKTGMAMQGRLQKRGTFASNVRRGVDAPVAIDLAGLDISRLVQIERARLINKGPSFDYEDFNNLTMCYQEIESIAAKCIPGFECTVDFIGDSTEKRPIKRLKIAKRGLKRKIMWVDATTHAREWLTTATLFKIIKNMQDNYKIDPVVTSLLDKYDWHFIPVINPDGYEYSWKYDRTWRKNRRINSNIKCPGVDLNRNADKAWGTEGSNDDECSEMYRGPKVASEPETQALKRQYKLLGPNVLQLVNIHAYGQYWLTSYGYLDSTTGKCYRAPDDKETLRVANEAANAIEKVFNTTWQRGPICSVMYTAPGLLIDDAKDNAGIRYAAVPEVRGQTSIVPPSQITPSFKEIWAGIVASVKAIENGPFFDQN